MASAGLRRNLSNARVEQIPRQGTGRPGVARGVAEMGAPISHGRLAWLDQQLAVIPADLYAIRALVSEGHRVLRFRIYNVVPQ
jgi:hypothetical protein